MLKFQMGQESSHERGLYGVVTEPLVYCTFKGGALNY